MTSVAVRLIPPTGGELLGDPEGVQDRFLVEAADTDGRMSVIEHVMAPSSLAAPMHRHTREDEFSFVLEGRVGAILGDEEVIASTGDLLFKPRGQWHTFWNAGTERARVLELISPAGLEELFRRLDTLDDWPDPSSLAEMADSYGCAIDLDATMPLVEKHGLRF